MAGPQDPEGVRRAWRDPDMGVFREAWAKRPPSPDDLVGLLPLVRAGFEGEHAAIEPAAGCAARPLTEGPVRGEWLAPAEADAGRVLLYFHGGGHLFGSARSYRHLVSRLATAAGAAACVVDYPLAPEQPFPAAIDAAVAAYRWLLSQGFEPSRIVVGGDSAGGNLAAALLLALRMAQAPQPAGLYLLSPWLDMTQGGRSHRVKSGCDPLVTTAQLRSCASAYLAGASPFDPLASPIFGDLRDWPPVLIQVGADEVLLSDSLALADAAAMAGVSVTIEVWSEMVHAWLLFHRELGAAREAIKVAGGWIAQRTPRARPGPG